MAALASGAAEISLFVSCFVTIAGHCKPPGSYLRLYAQGCSRKQALMDSQPLHLAALSSPSGRVGAAG
eukprot:4289365-Amphidinium_carterae.1